MDLSLSARRRLLMRAGDNTVGEEREQWQHLTNICYSLLLFFFFFARRQQSSS